MKRKLIKNIKTLLIAFCSIMLIFSNVVFADQDITENGDYNISLSATLEPTAYEIVIPSTINLNESKEFDVLGKATFFLCDGEVIEHLIITPDETISMELDDNNSLIFDADVTSTLKEYYINTDMNTLDDENYSNLGTITIDTSKANYSGDWSGVLAFTYELKEIESEETD